MSDSSPSPSDEEPLPLELDAQSLGRLVAQALEYLGPYLESLPEQAAWDLDDVEEAARALRGPLPERGLPARQLLPDLIERYATKGFNVAGPGYLAYIPGGGIPSSAVAGFIAEVLNRYVSVWTAAPLMAELESEVIRWFCEIVGYPSDAGGILTSGGSMANFSAVVSARHKHLQGSLEKASAYVTDQGHHSLVKATSLAGIPPGQVRKIAVDEHFRVRVDALAAAIEADREAGLQPFLICANAGTTNTGAVDDLPALAALAKQQEVWLHVDAAYGGFFALTERGKRRLVGLELADSITLDPHKGLFLPYGSGSLLVRQPAQLRAAHSIAADYMPAMRSEPEFVDFCDISPELSRGNRGLRVWLPFKLHGLAQFRENLEEKLDLAEWACAELKQLEGIEMVAEPQLSLLAFRLRKPGLQVPELEALNRDLLARINAHRRVYLTPTLIEGRFTLRICVLSFRTHMERMQECLEIIRAEVLAS